MSPWNVVQGRRNRHLPSGTRQTLPVISSFLCLIFISSIFFTACGWRLEDLCSNTAILFGENPLMVKAFKSPDYEDFFVLQQSFSKTMNIVSLKSGVWGGWNIRQEIVNIFKTVPLWHRVLISAWWLAFKSVARVCFQEIPSSTVTVKQMESEVALCAPNSILLTIRPMPLVPSPYWGYSLLKCKINKLEYDWMQ